MGRGHLTPSGGGAPTGPAGGVLTGTYPNPGLANAAVALANLANLAASTLIGRDSTGAGTPEAITLGVSLAISAGGVLQRAALTGDVTAALDTNALTIAPAAVTLAKMANLAASTLIGRDSTGAGTPEAVTLAARLTMSAAAVLDIATASITDTFVAAANKDGAAGTASMRTLGSGSSQAAGGQDTRFGFVLSYSTAGALAVVTGQAKWEADKAYTVLSVRAQVGTAPTGAALNINVRKNGASTVASPNIAAAATRSGSVSGGGATLAANDQLTVDVTQVGSTVAGSDLVVEVVLQAT